MVFIESSSMTILEQRFLMGPMRPIGGLHEAGDNGPSSHETAAREHHPSTKHVEYTHGNIAVFVALRISFSPGCVGGAEHHHARKNTAEFSGGCLNRQSPLLSKRGQLLT